MGIEMKPILLRSKPTKPVQEKVRVRERRETEI